LAGFNIKALFRKIAAALPGMDSAAATAAAAARQEEQLAGSDAYCPPRRHTHC